MDKQQPSAVQERAKTTIERSQTQDISAYDGPQLKKMLINILQNKEVGKRNVKDLNIISTGLKQFDFFRKLQQERGEESLTLCALSLGFEKFEPGKNVIVHGEKGDKFYIILLGVLEVHVPNTAGEFIKVSELIQGQSFGELALLNDSPRRATIKTSSSCGLATLSKKSYLKIIADMEERVIKRKIEFLQSVALFKPISNRSLHEYIFYFKPLLFKWKECVYDIGQDAEFVYIIKEGEFVIQKTSKRLFIAEDKEKKLIQESKSDHVCELAILGVGEMFGEIDCLLNEKRTLQVICHSQSAEVLVVTKKHFIGRILDNYAVKKSFLKNYLANKMQHSSNRLQEIYQVLSIVEEKQTEMPLKTLDTICSSTENQPNQHTTRSFSPRQFSKGGSTVFRANKNYAQGQLNSQFIPPLQVAKRISPVIKTQKTAPCGLEQQYVKAQTPTRPILSNSSQKLRENLLNTLLKTNKPGATPENKNRNAFTPNKSNEKEVTQSRNRSSNNNFKSSETTVTKDASTDEDNVLHFPDLDNSLLFSPQKRMIRYSSMSARNNQLNSIPDNSYAGSAQDETILKTDNIESRIQKLNKIKLQICQAHNIDTSPTSIKQIGTVEKMELPVYLLLKLRSYSSQQGENKSNHGSQLSPLRSNPYYSPTKPSNLRWELHQQRIQNIINQIKQVEDLENHISPKNLQNDIEQEEFQNLAHQPVMFNTQLYSPQRHRRELRAAELNSEKVQQRTNQLLKTRGHPPINNKLRLQPIIEHISKSLII